MREGSDRGAFRRGLWFRCRTSGPLRQIRDDLGIRPGPVLPTIGLSALSTWRARVAPCFRAPVAFDRLPRAEARTLLDDERAAAAAPKVARKSAGSPASRKASWYSCAVFRMAVAWAMRVPALACALTILSDANWGTSRSRSAATAAMRCM